MSLHRTWIKVCLLSFACCLTAHATNYVYNPSATCTYSCPQTGTTGFAVKVTNLSTGSVSYGAIGSGTASGGIRTITSTYSPGAITFPQAVEFGSYQTTPSNFTACGQWFKTVVSGSGDISENGDFNEQGLPVNGNGEILAPDFATILPSAFYEAEQTLTNNTNKPIDYTIQIHVDDGSPSGVDRSFNITLQPGESTNLNIQEDHAFEFQVGHSSEGLVNVEGNGVEYTPVIDATGSGVGYYGGSTGAGGVGTPNNGTPTSSATPPTTSPIAAPAAAGTATVSGGSTGVTGDQAKTIGANIGDKVDRMTTAVTNAANAAHNDANALQDTLDALNKQKALGTGESPLEEQEPLGTGEGMQGVLGKVNMLYGDVTALAGMIAVPESGTATWNIAVNMGGPIGAFVLDLDQHATAYAIVRMMILLLVGTSAVYAAIAIIRGALVDEH